jgi:ubiquinone biosynthesis protein UbiJ
MPLFPILPAASRLVSYALNTLLKREDWARERLQRHAGKTVRCALGTSGLALTIDSEGYTDVADSAVVPDVVLSIMSEKLDVASLLGGGATRDFAELMHISGDAALAQLAADLARNLRWDAEDDLARVVGDIPAVRLMTGVRAVLKGMSTAGGRLVQNVSEYLAEESGLLAGKPLLQQQHHDLSSLADRIDALLQQTAALQARLGCVADRRGP